MPDDAAQIGLRPGPREGSAAPAGLEHIAGETYHGRRGRTANAFRYSIDYILCNAEAATRGPLLFSRNSANLFGLRDSDHGGPRKAGQGAPWVREVLAAAGLDLPGPILLLAQPRVLGHVFNPVSFWLCHGADGVLRAVIAEVTNTFGDRHSYLCHHDDLRPVTGEDTLTSRKIFHVSPFQPIDGDYSFRFDIRRDRIDIRIGYRSESDDGVTATLSGLRRPLTNAGILRAALRRPLGSRRVLALIHWQALKLWWKGARFRARPEPPTDEVSR
ncbi:DUF1365 domain-containing protein [Roseisalinus antarcticus]|uniref:Cyclopropane-fatty-acyl-phospholipid synthase n=1 Tax=Roseisalinus antarcticus TaxID=254357 RepID=A0A1Y5SMM6_9RHOB|nr:DUF1365 domain-containing protein [Roseisalinus antarcticus]SLN43643.1 hypothetical protein ROA7023_01787 [Roseisalinus antarcticus]